MFKILKYFVPYLLKHLKFLEKFKKSLFIFIWIKIISFLISFIYKSEKVGFTKMIKIIYWSLSAFNVILTLIIILNVTDLDQSQLLKLIYASLNIFIPTFILDRLSNYYIYFLEGFKQLMQELIKWVYSDNKLPNKSKMDDMTPEPIYDASILPYIGDDGVYHFKYDFEEEKSGNINWKTITLFVILALGISYYYYPDSYNQLYSNLKSLFSKDGGSSGPSGSSKPSGPDTSGSYNMIRHFANKSSEVPKPSGPPYGTTLTDKPFGIDGPKVYTQGDPAGATPPIQYIPLDPMANLQNRLESIFYSTSYSTKDKNSMIFEMIRKSLGDKNISDSEFIERNDYFIRVFNNVKNNVANSKSFSGKPVTVGFDVQGQLIYKPVAITPSSADITPTNTPRITPFTLDAQPSSSGSTTPTPTTNIIPAGTPLNNPSSSIPSGVETITPTLGRVASPQENIPSMPGSLPDITSRSIYNSPTMPPTRSSFYPIARSATSPVYGSFVIPGDVSSNSLMNLSLDPSVLFDPNGHKRTPVQIMDSLMDKGNKNNP